MKIKLNKVAEGKWYIEANGEVIGECSLSYKYHGSYEARLNNGITVNAFSQKSLKEMVEKNIG